MTTTPAERLKVARQKAGYVTAKAFADAHGIPQPTYSTHESGKRRFDAATAQDYAEKLGCSPAWLMVGEGPEPADQTEGIIPLNIKIREPDVRAMAGGGGADDLDKTRSNTAIWEVPREFISSQTTAPHNALRVIRIYGDSMTPMFNPGERVLVDTSDIIPSPAGVFVLWDGLGLVVKRLEHIPYSAPPTIRLMSANTNYQTYERNLDEVTINGRVIAKWQWT